MTAIWWISPSQPEPMPWDAYVNMAFDPKIPALREAMEQVLTPKSSNDTKHICGLLVEAGRGSRRMASTYLGFMRLERMT
jgi:hypothetical protein